jgi:hypothetical protein
MTFPLTPDQLAAKEAVLATNGIYISGPSGTINSHGVTANYSYDGTVLTVTVTGHPWYIPQDVVESKLSAFLS